MDDHRINWGRLYPGKTYKADCTCGWSHEGEREAVRAAVTAHENNCEPKHDFEADEGPSGYEPVGLHRLG